ncbi:hypothetical protein PV10_04391 [Exophiala mesophila]|uniref:Zn(2)-C6 fungal-type domain-containing protein n=1 Tax=Exophiala mesophila TaxID=212818 RepID=A0A0D2A267_EXOME|nr:uncharacterized protein PV10_04391 [Exophiala mesophila]KIV93153.1 hypothetical protein PV10_04391 [Exophiala mesophila]
MSVTSCTSPDAPTQVAQVVSKRTNSLGWAKSDCHTCFSLRRHCDRRRPRCSACIDDGIVCAGYVQQLDWERGKSRKGKPPRTGTTKKYDLTKSTHAIAQLPQPSAFVFVDESDNPLKPRKRSLDLSKSHRELGDVISGFGHVQPLRRHSSASRSSAPWTVARSASIPAIMRTALSIPISIETPLTRFEESLSFFHNCFAETTLTFPVPINPWQSAIPHIHNNNPCVRFAVLAVAQRQHAHLSNAAENVSVLTLKDKALSLFAHTLPDLSFEAGISTALLLLALDYAESGYSNWPVHLRGAHKILELNGGISLAESRPNLRSQVAMLLWYDVISALTSRCGPIFPRSYLETLMFYQSESEWSFLALSGLPDDLFVDMYDICVAAGRLDTITQEEVIRFQNKLWNFEIVTHGNEMFHAMCEAWRLCILLYCARVFPQPPPVAFNSNMEPAEDSEVAPATTSATYPTPLDPHDLAVQIIRYIAKLPPLSSLQKQCVLPAMLAGCEIRSNEPELRKIIVDYGERWKKKTGIWIWDSSSEFMGAVWAVNDQATGDDACIIPWTEVVLPSSDYGYMFG